MALSPALLQKALSNSNLLKLNLGAGFHPAPGMINCDLYEGNGIDKVFDLDEPWPFEDESACLITASHVFEHVKDHLHFMREANRILAKGGVLFLRMPHGWHEDAWIDPTHRRPFFPNTFGAFNQEHYKNFSSNPQHAPKNWPYRFKLIEVGCVASDWVRRLPFWTHYIKFMERHFLNAIREIQVLMEKE